MADLTVVAPRASHVKLQPVSTRLKGELVHPNRKASIGKLSFSPDGKRVIAGDYPGGVLAVWDVASGNLLRTIETGYGPHSSLKYFSVSPDWRTVYVSHEKGKYERVELHGKPLMKSTFDGAIRAWSVDTGKLIRTYKHATPRGIWWMALSADGSHFYTAENLSGITERSYKSSASVWNARSGVAHSIEGLDMATFGTLSPDGRFVAVPRQDQEGFGHGLMLVDTDTGRAKWSSHITDKSAWLYTQAFSPDGRLLFGTLRQFDQRKKSDHWRVWLKWWDAATGHEVASFEGDKDDDFVITVSPDGRTLAAMNWRGNQAKLLLFDIPQKRLRSTTLLGKSGPELQLSASGCAFSPDGKSLVVITRQYPKRRVGGDLDPADLPQPRILLVETATGAIRETMIAPPGLTYEACFSPDGRTLATNGRGRVLLWDMTKTR